LAGILLWIDVEVEEGSADVWENSLVFRGVETVGSTAKLLASASTTLGGLLKQAKRTRGREAIQS